MLDSVDEDLLEGVKMSLNNLKVLKRLVENGYSLGKNVSYYLGSHDDAYVIQEEFMETVVNLVCGNDCWDWEHANLERGNRLGYDMIYDEDEITVTEILLTPPVIVEYLAWLKEYEIKSEDCHEFHSLVSKLITTCSWGDYQVYESFVAKDYSGIVMLFTDYDYVNAGFSETLMDIMEYCKKNMDRKKEGEDMYESA